MDSIISFENVTYRYKTDEDTFSTVLENFNLNIERGSFTVILGHNGSGKSTIAKLMNGLYKPERGSVTVNNMSTLDEENDINIKKCVGMVFQNPDNQLVASVVEDDVAFGPENLGIEPSVIRQRVDNALKSVDMFEFAKSAPHNLSGGQKQRVAIAGIIAMEPECIVLDEPTAMLDPKGRLEVMKTVNALNKEKGITVVLITHFMEHAAFADRILVVDDGKILADDKPSTVFSNIKLLKKCGLDIPQTTELIDILADSGLNFPKGIISVEDTANALLSVLK